MYNQLIIAVLIFVLASCTHAMRQFKDEYPNVTVCESTLPSEMEAFDMPHSYRFLKGHFSDKHRCTHIEGNLIIKNIWPEEGTPLDFSFLEYIEEVSGMVVLNNNTIDNIILPRLKVIRGNDFLNLTWKNNTVFPVSLFMRKENTTDSAHLILPSLRVISKHSVYFGSNEEHPFLPHSIRWAEIFENKMTQWLLTTQPVKDFFGCHSNCSLRSDNGSQGYCWSPSYEHCQERTKCKETNDGEDKWCYYKRYGNEIREINCNTMCAGGCRGIRSHQCYVCKFYINGDECTSSCPPQYKYVSGYKVKNPDFKLRVAMMCATSCPSNLLQQVDACIYKCTTPEFYRVNETCQPCTNNEQCQTDCFIKESCKQVNQTSFFMTRPILERLKSCEHIVGQLHFSAESFNMSQGGISVPMMYEHLSKVRIITGHLAIDGSLNELHNLTFLQNLEEIRHFKQNECVSGTTALLIIFTDLQFLGLRRLRHIIGDFYQDGNPHLCYLNTIPWEKHVLKSNLHKFIPEACNKTCNSQCGTDGCWGPTSSMCYICKGVRAGYNCVVNCSDEEGYYTGDGALPDNHRLPISYDDGTCRRCNDLCLSNCTGPSASDCVGGCRFFKEVDRCVANCSKEFYPANKTCKRCSDHCSRDHPIDRVCSGDGDHMGAGGCSYCNRFILKEEKLLCYQGECPDGYYVEISPRRSQRICRTCTEPCSRCIGPSTYDYHCVHCGGFWSRKRCVKDCISDSSVLIQPKIPGDTCNLCHDQCNNCTSAYDASSCTSCKNKRVYLTSLQKFTCVEHCPKSHSYSYKVDDYDVCISNSEGQERERIVRQKKVLNIVFWIIGPMVVMFLFASVVIFLILKSNRKMKSCNYLRAVYSNIHEPDSRVLLFNRQSSLAQPNMNRLRLIPTTDIVFDIHGKPLGKGAFGSVYRGKWKLINDDKKRKDELDVAIKVIQVVSQKTMKELMAEATVMASVSHKHCLRLIGLCLLQQQPCLVTTFMELGSLDKYLKKHRDTLSSYTLLSWSEQIANGMAYLEMRGIIHRDLATRNVLLNSLQFVQITDFGLSRILQGTEDNNEIIVTCGQVPVRWLALETLESGIYSHKTDVWAYGVTLWEIFTFGERPYNDIDIKDIQAFLSQNNRLSQPEICSLLTYAEMLGCWKEPQYRSTFEELMIKFANFCQHPTYYLNIPNDPCLINSRFMNDDNDGLNPDGRSKGYMWRSIYKQLPSLDGTIVTCLDEYYDSENNSKVRRQSSNLSYLSNKMVFSDKHESISPLLFQSSSLQETNEEDDGYLMPNNTRKASDDLEYLEPISRY